MITLHTTYHGIDEDALFRALPEHLRDIGFPTGTGLWRDPYRTVDGLPCGPSHHGFEESENLCWELRWRDEGVEGDAQLCEYSLSGPEDTFSAPRSEAWRLGCYSWDDYRGEYSGDPTWELTRLSTGLTLCVYPERGDDPVIVLRRELKRLSQAVQTFFRTSNPDGSAVNYNAAVDALRAAQSRADDVASSFDGWE